MATGPKAGLYQNAQSASYLPSTLAWEILVIGFHRFHKSCIKLRQPRLVWDRATWRDFPSKQFREKGFALWRNFTLSKNDKMQKTEFYTFSKKWLRNSHKNKKRLYKNGRFETRQAFTTFLINHIACMYCILYVCIIIFIYEL